VVRPFGDVGGHVIVNGHRAALISHRRHDGRMICRGVGIGEGCEIAPNIPDCSINGISVAPPVLVPVIESLLENRVRMISLYQNPPNSRLRNGKVAQFAGDVLRYGPDIGFKFLCPEIIGYPCDILCGRRWSSRLVRLGRLRLGRLRFGGS